MSAFIDVIRLYRHLAISLVLASAASAGAALAEEPTNTDSARNYVASYVNSSSYGNVSALLGAGRFYDDGITGQDTISANVEGGHIWDQHEALLHVSELYTGPYSALGSYDDHATMCGTMLGGSANYASGALPDYFSEGIALGTDLRSGAFASSINPDGSFTFDSRDLAAVYNHFFGTADVINSSFGNTDPSGTSSLTKIVDAFAYENPATTMVCAAGNEGPSSNSVGGPASGYNSISVGAMGNPHSFDTIASFSSRGPSTFSYGGTTIPGVRATVDICAPGVGIVGAGYDSSNPSDTDSYYYGDGTSFAAPIVAGGVALLKSASKHYGLNSNSLDSRVVKSVLLNSAGKPAGWDNGQSSVGGVVTTTQSLDWKYGAGVMDLDAAYDQLLSGTKDADGLGGGTIEEIGWDFGRLGAVNASNDYHFSAALLADTTFSVTLSWFCDRTLDISPSGYATTYDNALADLDIEIYDAADTLVATSASDYNPVEHLYFTIAETGEYYIRVLYDEQTYGSVSDVYYGLAWSATVVPEPSQIVMLLGLAGMLFVRRRRR
ncbi:MAG: S8 family serine peptidase [Pirellulales bacterium]|nr:S8 family serine peptidase [Pirellulales bacterium]